MTSPRPASQPLSVVFFTLWLVPTILGLPPLLAVLLTGRNVPHRSAIASLVASFILSGGVYSLLLFARVFNGHLRPSTGLCAAQSSLVAGLDMLMICMTMAVIYAMLSEVQDANKGENYKDLSKTRKPISRALMIVPYFLWTVSAIYSAVIFTTADSMSRVDSFYATHANLPYCAPKDDVILVMFYVNITLYALAIIFSICVLVAYVRTRCDSESWAVLDHAILARDAVVVVPLLLIMGVRVSYIPLVYNPAPDLLLAITAMLVAIVYGSQAEVLRAWRRWLQLEHAYTEVGAQGPR